LKLFKFRASDRGKTAGACGTQPKPHHHMNITTLAEVNGNLHIGLAALGSALAVGIIGYKASEAVGRNPGAATAILIQAILSSALAEGIVFFAIFLAR
jgi:F-type H+-transporting ATPase subunit c